MLNFFAYQTPHEQELSFVHDDHFFGLPGVVEREILGVGSQESRENGLLFESTRVFVGVSIHESVCHCCMRMNINVKVQLVSRILLET